MTSAGWYPDPAGTPHTFRYWDGQSWSQATSTDPFGQQAVPQPPPAPQPPQPPPVVPPQPVQQSYGAMPETPQWSPMPGVPTPASTGGSHTGRTIAIVAGAVAFLVLLAIIAFVAVRTVGNDDNASPSAQAPATTASPTEPSIPGTSPSSPPTPAAPLGTITPTATQCAGVSPALGGSPRAGLVTAGGLAVPSLKDHGYRTDVVDAQQLSFASGVTLVSKQVSAGWISMMAVGALPKSNGFTSPEQAARVVLTCMANDPSMYRGAYALPEVSASARSVDGHRAYSLVQQIKVHDSGTTEAGDTVQVVVVDTGNAESYGLFVMGVPIGDKHYLALQKSTAAQLRVE